MLIASDSIAVRACSSSARGRFRFKLHRLCCTLARNDLYIVPEQRTTAPSGARTSKIAPHGGSTYLHYGPDARLARAGFHANPGNTQAVHYRYNALGQRIAKSDQRLLTSTTAITQQTVYADNEVGSTVLCLSRR